MQQGEKGDERSMLDQSNVLLYGGGHGPPWKGRASPLVLAGKAGTRGPGIIVDFSRSTSISSLPASPDPQLFKKIFADHPRGSMPSPLPSSLEGRVENHDRKKPMVTSALSNKSFLSIGSTRQLSSSDQVNREEEAISWGTGSLTEPESRQADAHEGEGMNMLVGDGKDAVDQVHLEEKERKRSSAERIIQKLDQRDEMVTTPAVEECFVRVKMRELDEYDARNEVACLEIEQAFRFEQLMGNTVTFEPGYRVFTWALDWTFDEAMNEEEIPLAVQMRMWEEDEMRKMQEEGLRNPLIRWRIRNVEEQDEGLDLGRLYEELRNLGRDRHTRVGQEQEQVDRRRQPDEWIQTSVWIIEELGRNSQVDGLQERSVGLRIFPREYSA
jgi:hypothetical protein